MSKELTNAVRRVRAERAPKPRWTWGVRDTNPTTWVNVLDDKVFVCAMPANLARILVDALNAKERK